MASEKAERIVRSLLEMPMDTGGFPDYIHPEKKDKIRNRTHPLGRNPAFPNQPVPQGSRAEHWEEYLASEQYQATMGRLTDFLRRAGHELAPGNRGFGTAMQAMFAAVMQAASLEEPHKEELEKMAIDLIFEQPEFRKLKQPYLDGEFKIDAQLGSGDLTRAVASTDQQADEPEDEEAAAGAQGALDQIEEEPGQGEPQEEEAEAAQALQQFDDPEVAKRHVINALIHGGAVSKNYAYQLIGQELSRFSPDLVTLYGIAMAGSELGYFATPDSFAATAARTPGMVGGSAEVTFEPTEPDLTSGQPGGSSEEFGDEQEQQPEGRTVPVVHARGLIFPMLIQELTKGLLELVSYEGLPKDPQKARDVIDKTDLVDQESWAMIMGRGLWTRFVSALGGNDDEITMHLYNRIVQMPPDQFNRTMQTIQAGGPQASELVKRLAQDVRMDMEAQDRAESGFANQDDQPPDEPEGQESWR